MPSTPTEPSGREVPEATRAFRWDLVGVAMAIAMAGAAALLLDTSHLARWVGNNRDAKVDEVIVVTFVLVCGLALLLIRRWLGYSHHLIKFERSRQPADLPSTSVIHTAFRRDLIGVSIALVLAVVAVSVLDTGSLAEWVANQSHTRVDEAIVATFMLMVGLSFFSIRRSVELSKQLKMLEELHRTTAQLNREARLLSELSDLLQSCRSLDEAYRLIAERAQVLFPGLSGALGMIANSRDVVDVAATWGTPSMAGQFFPLADCWALRRGRPQLLDSDPAAVRCAHTLDPRGRNGRSACR
jgi:hypothetical protein